MPQFHTSLSRWGLVPLWTRIGSTSDIEDYRMHRGCEVMVVDIIVQ